MITAPNLSTIADGTPASHPVSTALGEALQQWLDLGHWEAGPALEELLNRVQTAIRTSIAEEARLRDTIRSHVLAELRHFPDAPAAAGVYMVDDHWLEAARRHLLLVGQVTACDGAAAGHDGLTATVAAIGVCLVRYDGTLNSWRSTFLRHDYDLRHTDPVAQLRTVLDRRAGQTAVSGTAAANSVHTLLRRGLMALAERTALVRCTSSRWKVGHGVPAPLELLTGSGSEEVIDQALPILEALLLADKRWIFFPDTLADRALLTLVNALKPGELAILQNGKPMLEAIIETANYAPGYRRKVEAFASRLGEAMVVGGYRASRYAPAQLFIAHADTAVEAGILAMTDSRLNPHQGSPLLLQLAGIGARTGMGLDAFCHLVEAAYAQSRSLDLYYPARIDHDFGQHFSR
jgi:hypothetical protein